MQNDNDIVKYDSLRLICCVFANNLLQLDHGAINLALRFRKLAQAPLDMSNAVALWARGGYIMTMFEYSPYPTDLARSSIVLFSSKQKHNQTSSVMLCRVVIHILVVTFDLELATDVPWDSGNNSSVELFMNTEAAALARRVGFDCNNDHVMILKRISLPRLWNNLNFNLTSSSSFINNHYCH